MNPDLKDISLYLKIKNKIEVLKMSKYKFLYEASHFKKYKGQFKEEVPGDENFDSSVEDAEIHAIGGETDATEKLIRKATDLIRIYLIKSGIPSARASYGSVQIYNLIKFMKKDNYSPSTARVLDKYLQKFYSQLG